MGIYYTKKFYVSININKRKNFPVLDQGYDSLGKYL